MDIETCCVCSEPTERAGRSDDSIYAIAQQTFPLSPNGVDSIIFEGEEVGPLCKDCYTRMENLGLLETDE